MDKKSPLSNSQLEELNRIFIFFKRYLKNPIDAIRFLPEWSWVTTILISIFLASLTTMLKAITQSSFPPSIFEVIFFPISNLIGQAIFSGFLYYTFYFFFHRPLNYKKLLILITLISFPLLILNIAAHWIAPLTLLGGLISALLLAVGITENFLLDGKKTVKLISVIYVVFTILWISSVLSTSNQAQRLKDSIQPEAIEILEEEMKQKHLSND